MIRLEARTRGCNPARTRWGALSVYRSDTAVKPTTLRSSDFGNASRALFRIYLPDSLEVNITRGTTYNMVRPVERRVP